MSEKYYQLGTHNAEQWHEIHNELIGETSGLANVPDRCVECADEKTHSLTRGTFLLTDEEAATLKEDIRVKFLNIDYASYPEQFKPPPEELYATPTAKLLNRWNGENVKIYREFEVSNTLPGTPGAEDYNRASWSLIRHAQKLDPYVAEGRTDNYVYQTNVTQYGDGKDVDVIVADDGGGWIGHPEFQNNCTGGAAPNGYTGGNVLPGNGTCDVLDVVLDGPYYLDPDYFDEFTPDPEYNNGAIGNVSGDGSDFFKREVTTNGVRIMGAGSVGGQVAVPDAWLEKVARMFELFLDPNGAGINESFQRAMIQTLSGDAGTYHAGFPTIQRVARGAGADYTPNFLTDDGIIAWNLTNLFDTHVQNDMVWYLNSTGGGYGVGDIDAQEVIEHVFHTLHMHGLPAEDIKLYPYLASDWNTSDLYNAMVEAYDAGKWDPSGYQSPADAWKTDGDAFEVAAKEYLYLLNFCMFEYTELWDGGSLAPEWTDDMRTQAGIQANNPLGYAFHNTWIAPVISKPSLATIRSIFQDGNTPDQDDPTLAGASGYFVSISDKLETRWDGTVVPVESFARAWWSNSNNRSAIFKFRHPDAGYTATITSGYTRSYCNGSNTAQSSVGTHCTPCMALTYGRTQGWAYNANKWVLNLYGTNGADIEPGFDVQKIFHNTKPINPKYGTKNPTVSSNSWGYRASKGTVNGYYHFRTDAPVQYGGTGDEPLFISHMGLTGDGGRWKSEMKTNSLTTALDELIDAGVIFVCAAGNSNQKQVNWGHQDFDNYVSATSDQTLEQSSYFEFGVETTGSTNRRGFPQQGGKTVDGITGEVTYKTINIGALDDDYATGNLERKVNYSDRGNGINAYFAADGTLAANRAYTSEGRYPDTYPGFTANSGSGSGVPEDCAFGGTSAACPVAAGFISTLMGLNRGWTYADVQAYFAGLDNQDGSVFYQGTESTSATDSNWNDYNSLEGGPAKVGYQKADAFTQTSFPVRSMQIGNGLTLTNVQLTRGQRFDRGT